MTAARPRHEVVELTPELVRKAADGVAEGFADNEIWLWLIGSERRLRALLPHHYRVMMRQVFIKRAAAWTTSVPVGAALWMPPGTQELSLTESLAEIWALMPHGMLALRRGAAFDRVAKAHRPEEPHWYLNTLSIAPAHQRTGAGSALLAPGLERADAEGLGCYLETQRQSNIPFYRRFGFEETGKIGVLDSPPLWLMWRPPQS